MVQLGMRSRCLTLFIGFATAISCSGGGPLGGADLTSKTANSLTVSAAEFQPGQPIPVRNSATGGNVSPQVSWSNVPAETKSVALIVDDSDARGFVHWVIYNIPPGTTLLPSGLPASATVPQASQALQGKNSAGSVGYFGPKPPPGDAHHYHFHVYALDEMLPISAGKSKDDVERAMSGHVLAQGELIGLFRSS